MPINISITQPPGEKRYWLNGLVLSALYIAFAKLGLSFTTVGENITLIWPPTGIALSALLVLGRRYWPWIFLGAFVVNATTGITLLACLGIAIGNTLEAVLATYLLRRADFNNRLTGVRDVLMLVLLAAGVSTMMGATFGALSLTTLGVIPWQTFDTAWLTWWMGDAMGALVITPLLLSWWYSDSTYYSAGKRLEAILLLAGVIVVSQIVFGNQIVLWDRQLPLAFMTFPFLTWAALRYGMRGATTVVVIVGMIILGNIIFREGPFAQGSTFESLTLLWLYTNFMAITSLVLAAAIVERHMAEMGMRHMAQHDHLTGLLNRIALLDRIDHAISIAERYNRSFAILFLDIDRFKVINDSLGHAMGDAMLKEISQRLLHSVRSEDTVSRLGGDEFVVLLEEVTRPEDVYVATKHIINAIREPIQLAQNTLHSSASVGVCIYPQDGRDASTLLKHADIAMYRAKDIGRNTYFFYTADMNIQAERRLNLEMELRNAYQHKQFILHYQPQYDARTGKVICAEALIRWMRTPDTCVYPDEFIPVLEETGQIIQVGAWVIDEACSQLAKWHDAGMNDMRIAVNLSSYQLNSPNLGSFIANSLQAHGISPDCLEVEITESMLVRQESIVAENCEHLINLGVRLAVDDFGTGYSSLSYLHRLSIDTLKIDRSFIEKIPGNADSETIARAIVGLGKSLNLTLVAEGIENDQQCDFIRQLGCDAVQGFLFSKPLVANEFEILYRTNTTETAQGAKAPCGNVPCSKAPCSR